MLYSEYFKKIIRLSADPIANRIGIEVLLEYVIMEYVNREYPVFKL